MRYSNELKIKRLKVFSMISTEIKRQSVLLLDCLFSFFQSDILKRNTVRKPLPLILKRQNFTFTEMHPHKTGFGTSFETIKHVRNK